MGRWLDGFFENNWLRLVRHNSATNALESNGAVVTGVAEYTFTEMTTMTGAQIAALGGIYVNCTDRHNSAAGIGGSLWIVDVTAQKFVAKEPIYYATLAAAIADVPPASWSGLRIFTGDVGAVLQSNGTDYLIDGGVSIINRSAAANRVISPAATFTSVTPTSAAAGADTLLTSAGVHGLTTAICVTAGVSYIPILGGTNWTVGLHKINAIAVDTTGVTIQIDTPWNAGFGTPTIALAGTEFVLAKIAVPPLTASGFIDADVTWGSTSGAGTKTTNIRLGATGAGLSGTAFYAPTAWASTTLCVHPVSVIIQNRGATNSQVNQYPSANGGAGANASTVAATTGAIQTNVATELVLTGKMTSANDPIWLDRYVVKIGT